MLRAAQRFTVYPVDKCRQFWVPRVDEDVNGSTHCPHDVGEMGLGTEAYEATARFTWATARVQRLRWRLVPGAHAAMEEQRVSHVHATHRALATTALAWSTLQGENAEPR